MFALPVTGIVGGGGSAAIGPVIEGYQKTTASGSTHPFVVNKPAGIIAGELGVIVFSYFNAGAVPDPFLGVPAGWTKRSETKGGNYSSIVIATKTLGGSEGNPAFTHAVFREYVGWYLRISGADNADPWNASAQLGAYTSSMALGVTTDEPSTLGVLCRSQFGSGLTFTVSNNGWTEIQEGASGGTNPLCAVIGSKPIASAGASGNATTVSSSSPGSGSNLVCFAINGA